MAFVHIQINIRLSSADIDNLWLQRNLSIYLVHRFISCGGTPHVCLACAGACHDTIMFKIVCLKITAMSGGRKTRTELINCSK